MTGTVDILNCKLGDLKLSFDRENPVEAERARRAVKQMLRDGFVLFVEVDGGLRRVEEFDDKHDHYIISDVPGVSAPAAVETTSPEPEIKADVDPPRTTGKRGRKRGVPASSSRATAVAPRSGG